MFNIFSANTQSSSKFSSSLVKIVLRFSDRAGRIADAHDAAARFSSMRGRQLADIGLSSADRDYAIRR